MTHTHRVERKELRLRRKAAGIKRQDMLAKELGWSTETIVDIEQERLKVDEATDEKIDAAIARIVDRRQREEIQCQRQAGAVV
jgi:DNA-binding XRE family transcriptional regulator